MKGSNGLKTFWESLKRIAFYRLVRSVIKEITAAFSEGIKNLYHWSDLVNGHFAASMDRLATSSQYLKNSLGAMVSPLIETLVPVLDVIIDKVVDVLNFFNMLVSAVSGADTYTVAKKAAAVWEDSSKKTSGAAKRAADDIKRTILGFDEINKLVKPNSSSGGGGNSSANQQPNYAEMFEEKPLTGIFKKISDITEGWPDWLKALLGIGGTALAIFGIPALLKKIWDGLKNLFSFNIPDWFKWLFGPKGDGDVGIDIPDHIDIPDGTVKVNVEKGDWSTLDELSGKSMYVSPKLDNSGSVLFNKLKDEWNAARTPLYASPKLDNTASGLCKNFKSDWNDIESRTVYVSPKLDNTGKVLFDDLKREWDDITSRTLFVSVAISQTAKYLFDTLKKNWNKITSKTLYVNAAISQSAKYLYDALENHWKEIISKTLYVNAAISQSAKYLYDALERNWKGIISKTLYVNVAISQSALSLYNALKKNWNDIVSKTLYFNVAISQSALLLYNGLKDAWSNLTNRTLYVNVSIIQSAQLIYDTLRGNWNSLTNRTLYVNVLISQSAQYLFDALKGKWNSLTSRTLYVNVAISQSAQYLFDALKGKWNSLTNRTLNVDVGMGDTPSNKAKTLWDRLKSAWDASVTAVDKSLDVFVKPAIRQSLNSAATLGGKILDWLFPGASAEEATVDVTVEAKPGWGFVNSPYQTGPNSFTLAPINDTSVNVGAVGAWDSTVGGILPYLGVNDLSSFVWMDTVTSWASTAGGILSWLNVTDLSSDILMDLKKDWGTQTPQSYLGLDNLSTTIKAKLKVDNKANKATIKISASNAGSLLELTQDTKALGGIFSGGTWRNIPQYAGGTTNAGSLFLAGEAGPELVGHVGGRTEVLNKSQLASAMYAAVQSAMAPASANFAAAAQSMGYGSAENDYHAMYDVIFDAVSEAMAGDSGSRERTQLLRQINDKDFTAEISTASLNRAQNRMNRRAGTTLVPVG